MSGFINSDTNKRYDIEFIEISFIYKIFIESNEN